MFYVLNNVSYSSEISDHQIIRVNENMMVGKKKVPYQDKNGIAKIDDVYFVLERLESNRAFWDSYVTEQMQKTRRNGVGTLRYDGKYTQVSLNDGIDTFKQSIDKNKFDGKRDIWVAYATRKDPRLANQVWEEPEEPAFPEKPFGLYKDQAGKVRKKSSWSNEELHAHNEYTKRLEEYFQEIDKIRDEEKAFEDLKIKDDDIEMIVSSFMGHGVPIVNHLGIARNYKYFSSHDDLNPHLGLSMQLHAFAAIAAKIMDGSKIYMVTKPVPAMLKIMFKAFEENDLLRHIWVGDYLDRKRIQERNGQLLDINEELSSQANLLYCGPMFYPTDSSVALPFDNSDSQHWKVTSPEGNVIEFDRPYWYGQVREDGSIYGHHSATQEGLSTAILDINALEALWNK